ncbi:MAG: hypothetical protein CMI18_03815 [Opitutaceae bacterium]|nr:hypothetical protein [Opitutaceae bacterium]
MSSYEEKTANFGNPIVNLIWTGLVFLFFAWILRPHVPAQTELLGWAGSAFASIALTITFYLCINMFRVCLNDYKDFKNKR